MPPPSAGLLNFLTTQTSPANSAKTIARLEATVMDELLGIFELLAVFSGPLPCPADFAGFSEGKVGRAETIVGAGGVSAEIEVEGVSVLI